MNDDTRPDRETGRMIGGAAVGAGLVAGAAVRGAGAAAAKAAKKSGRRKFKPSDWLTLLAVFVVLPLAAAAYQGYVEAQWAAGLSIAWLLLWLSWRAGRAFERNRLLRIAKEREEREEREEFERWRRRQGRQLADSRADRTGNLRSTSTTHIVEAAPRFEAATARARAALIRGN